MGMYDDILEKLNEINLRIIKEVYRLIWESDFDNYDT